MHRKKVSNILYFMIIKRQASDTKANAGFYSGLLVLVLGISTDETKHFLTFGIWNVWNKKRQKK
jgi:hypothetical protein